MKEKIVSAFAGGVLIILIAMYLVHTISSHSVIRSCDDVMNLSLESLTSSDMIINTYGIINKALGRGEILDGVSYVTLDNGYIGASADKFDISEEVNCILELSGYCKDNNLDFMYVNIPSKPFEDSELLEIGVPCYANANAEEFMNSIAEHNLVSIDFTDLLLETGDPYSYMYKTDHHWNTTAGLFAARKLIEIMNNEFDYSLEVSELEDSNLEYTYYQDCWLGETGKRLSLTFTELDDYTKIVPTGDTHFSYAAPDYDMYIEGTFSESMINEKVYSSEGNYYDMPSWHYSYLFGNYVNAEIHNFQSTSGKNILLIKDSYSLVVAPFLALCCDNVYLFDMRYSEDSLIDYIDNHDIDSVIVIYGNRAFTQSGWDCGMFDFFR